MTEEVVGWLNNHTKIMIEIYSYICCDALKYAIELCFLCLNKQIWFQEMFDNLGDLLCTITGFDSFSLQPNAGAAGEYAGLMVIRAYHMVWY